MNRLFIILSCLCICFLESIAQTFPNYIAHGGGALGSCTYSNSREAILQSIERGYSFIEIDLDTTSANYGNLIAAGVSTLSGKAETTQFLVKEDFSFGITDTLAVIGMVQYDNTKIKFKDWKDSSDPTFNSPSDSYSSHGFNLFGIGLQDRFVDNDDWIAMISGYYQHQKDTANTFIGELKAGYKVDRTTVYGLVRAGYSRLTDGDIYGAYVESNGDYLMLSYKVDTKDIFQIEGGLGVFAVLNKYFTLNGELTYGYYDWHNQLSLKAAIGWQPNDWFALNLYGRAALYDSAKSKDIDVFYRRTGLYYDYTHTQPAT